MSYEAYQRAMARLRENGLTTQPADSKSARETAEPSVTRGTEKLLPTERQIGDHTRSESGSRPAKAQSGERGRADGPARQRVAPSASNRTDTPPASARCDVAVNGLCRVHDSLDCRAVKDALLAERTKERDELRRLLFREVNHDHDCYSHDGRNADYDAAWLLFFLPYGRENGGDYTELGRAISKEERA
jgi:hypothetical protein